MSTSSDRTLVELTHPPGWRNPRPPPAGRRYDLVAIGGGTAGLVAAAGAAALGARTALIERDLLGGECLTSGCVPSKSVLSAVSGRQATATPPEFAEVIATMRRTRTAIAHHDAAAAVAERGVDVYFGAARFTGRRRLEVDGQAIAFHRALLATGSQPLIPDVPGLSSVGYLTPRTLFDLTRRPDRLLIVGAGPVGCEMAQAFARLGTEVTLLERAQRILPRDDEDAARLVADELRGEGIQIATDATLFACHRQREERTCAWRIDDGDENAATVGTFDAVLVAAGRRGTVDDGLQLSTAGVATGADGVVVDDRLRTSNRAVYAAGDVIAGWRFTHAAEAMARAAVRNALLLGRRRLSRLVIPWCTFTDPAVAHVGMSTAEAQRRGGVETLTVALKQVDRAVIDWMADGRMAAAASTHSAAPGFARLHLARGRVAGATLVGRNAGEVISELTSAVRRHQRLSAIGQTIRPYPTVAQAINRLNDAHLQRRVGRSWPQRVLRAWLRLRPW